MPNWVYNNLTIAPDSEAGGTLADVRALVEQVGAPYERQYKDYRTEEMETVKNEDPFSFWNIVKPEGEDLQKYEESLGAAGATPFWYDWNCNNWGAKWDACDVELIDHTPDHKQYKFSTAWSPPVEVLISLSAQHPNLWIELEWEEEQGFGGTYVFRNGTGTETNYYDIPSSHAEYADRDKECACGIWEDEEAPFSDCPRYVEPPSPDMLVPNDEIIVESLV